MAQTRRDEIYDNRWYRAGPTIRPNESQLPPRPLFTSVQNTSRNQARSRAPLLKPDDGTGRLAQNLGRLSLTSGLTRKTVKRTNTAIWDPSVGRTAKKFPRLPAPPPWKQQEDIINHQLLSSKRPAASAGTYQKARKSSSSSTVEQPRFVLGLGFTIHERVQPVKPAQMLDLVDEEQEDDSSSEDTDSALSVSSEDELELEPAIDDTSDDDEEVCIIPHVPPPELQSLLESLRPVHRLPFLPRNLRAGFLRACRKAGVKTDLPSASLPPDIDVILTYQTEQGKNMSYSTTTRGWCCPLCKEQGLVPFRTQHMLLAHLRWNHAEFEVKCSQVFNFYDAPKDRPTFRLHLTLPSRLIPAEIQVSPEPVEALHSPEGNVATTDDAPDELPTVYPSTGVVLPGTPPETSREATEESQLSSGQETDPSSVTEDSRGPSLEASAFWDSEAERTPVPQLRRSTRRKKALVKSPVQRAPPQLDEDDESSVEERPCTPPPPENRLGPAAIYPYVPFKSYDRGQDIEYSCRPLGAKLYDLVGVLSMKKFGVLAWDVITQEEEIFESEDYTDEQKVIHALWARWITLNKPKFIGSYFQGTKAFIDEYWEMIHYAAGHRALCWLLYYRLAERQLTSSQIVDLVRYYEQKTRMKDWYTRDTPPINNPATS
ncbi:hypothetical protein BDZ89DRAFT_1107139 [Hymenopellis radicata]|nr:hypothetical protein BDZ89DRAFT_1107139 [Hymenopellis radicata]